MDRSKDRNNEQNIMFEEVTIRTTPIFEGRMISLQVDEVRLPDGTTSTREIVRHPGAVAVLAVHEGRMLVVEQYRKALERSQVEIPAGKLEPGEDPMAAAARELEEETGYAAESLRHLASLATSPGFADEIIHLYFAEGLRPGKANPDEDEFLRCDALTLDEAKAMVLDGRICDAKTITAIYMWQAHTLTGAF